MRRTAPLISAYVLTRALLLMIPLQLLPYPAGDRVADDVILYQIWANVVASGSFPVGDPMWQYPPLAGFVFWAGTSLARTPLLGFMLLALAADAAVFGLLLYKGRADTRHRAAWAWVVAGAAIGPVMLTRFDIFPTVLAVAALLWASRPLLPGVLLGLGALLKVWPAALAVAWPRRSLPRVAALIVATAIGGLALLSAWGPGSLSFLSEQRDRGLQIESVPAIGFVVAKMAGTEIIYSYGSGCVEVLATGTRAVAITATVASVAALVFVAYKRLRGDLEEVPGPDVALLIVLLAIVTSRVFSPQFMIWVAGVGSVCLLDPKTRMRPVLALLLPAAVLGQLVFPLLYGDLMSGGALGSSVQILRILLVLAATALAAVTVFRSRRTYAGISQSRMSGSRPSRRSVSRLADTSQVQSDSTQARPRAPS